MLITTLWQWNKQLRSWLAGCRTFQAPENTRGSGGRQASSGWRKDTRWRRRSVLGDVTCFVCHLPITLLEQRHGSVAGLLRILKRKRISSFSRSGSQTSKVIRLFLDHMFVDYRTICRHMLALGLIIQAPISTLLNKQKYPCHFTKVTEAHLLYSDFTSLLVKERQKGSWSKHPRTAHQCLTKLSNRIMYYRPSYFDLHWR